MRLDKYLKNSRLIKRRTVAKEACDEQRVSVNGKIAKPGTELERGDIVHIEFGNSSITVEVVSLPETVRKESAPDMYRIMNE